MFPHPQLAPSNMEPCTVCGEKRISRNQTDAEKQPKAKIQLNLQAELWQPQNAHTHTKTKTQKTVETAA